MKALILAALLVLTPASSIAHPSNAPAPTDQSIKKTIDDHVFYCSGMLLGKESPDTIIQKLQLDTTEKKADFLVHCEILLRGINSGVKAATQDKQGKLND